jgi:hypothetical protein
MHLDHHVTARKRQYIHIMSWEFHGQNQAHIRRIHLGQRRTLGQPFEEKSDILLYTKPMWDNLPEAMLEFASPIPVNKLREKRWIGGGGRQK